MMNKRFFTCTKIQETYL